MRSANTGLTVLFLSPVPKERLNFSKLFPTPSPLGWPVLLQCQTPQVLVSENSNLRCVFFRLYTVVMQLEKDCWKREARAPKGCFLEINWQCRLGNALAFCHIWRPLQANETWGCWGGVCVCVGGGGGNWKIFIHLRQCDVLSMSHLNLGSGFIPVTWFIRFGENKLRRWCVVPCAQLRIQGVRWKAVMLSSG